MSLDGSIQSISYQRCCALDSLTDLLNFHDRTYGDRFEEFALFFFSVFINFSLRYFANIDT